MLLIVDFRYANALRRLAARFFDRECVKSRKRGAFVCHETSLRQESFGRLALALCVTVRKSEARLGIDNCLQVIARDSQAGQL